MPFILLHMLPAPPTLEVSQPETSREVSDEQSENMASIPVTFEVSKLETSRAVRDEQSENM